ncbi:MAG: di-trans,poly-cis-decaprenylcistransferase [Clostridia bacterium]|nr:di-trans,poly-cis-decaprenylcistransferase [Clostridia bacterium]
MGFFHKRQPRAVDFSDRVRHVAFIMDGNGRWAKKRGLPRSAGHVKGAENFRRILDACRRFGIRTVTVYAFSTENWSRPQGEVDGIMHLLDQYLDEIMDEGEKRVRVVFLGDKSPFSPALREKAEEIERRTAENPYCLNVALNYGGRDEIVAACRRLIAEGREEITQDDISASLYTAHSPDPDLVIRTGGDYRISNFLLWQSAYAEYYFTKTLWPDLSEGELYRALTDFCSRHRRFGGLDAEDTKKTN